MSLNSTVRTTFLRTFCKFVVICFTVAFLQVLSPSNAVADCGDYVQSKLLGSNHTDGMSHSTTKSKKCYSCRGATIPVTPPVSPPSIRIDIKALIKHDADSDSNIVEQSFLEQPFIMSEGFYPSLLRPPIA